MRRGVNRSTVRTMPADSVFNTHKPPDIPMWLAILYAMWIAFWSVPYKAYVYLVFRSYFQKRKELRDYYEAYERATGESVYGKPKDDDA